MGNQKLLFIVLGIVAVGAVGFFALANNRQAPSQEQNIVAERKADEKPTTTEDSTNDRGFSKRFLAYSDENLESATKNGRAVIFFHAGWCPSCQAAEKDFKANFNKVPADVTILKTDYDTSTELKQKYGITMQDTFIQVDNDGNEISKWNSGGEGLKTLLASLK